jgi:hypothetical protein
MSTYTVFVGNIGTVYEGTDLREAGSTFNDYVTQSKEGIGRASGESVTIFRDSELVLEHKGDIDNE